MVILTLILHGGVATFSLHSKICYFSFLLCKIKLVNVPSMMLCYTFINCGLPEGNATQCLCVPCFQVKRCCQRFMKKNTTLVLWWGLGTRGTESKIRLVGDRSTM